MGQMMMYDVILSRLEFEEFDLFTLDDVDATFDNFHQVCFFVFLFFCFFVFLFLFFCF